MENDTLISDFQIVAFSTWTDQKWVFVALFFSFYIIGLLMNLTTITVIYYNRHLHSPIYIFLSNLSMVDIYFPNVIVPELLAMLLSGNNVVTFTQCFSQVYFLFLAGTTEDMILLTMAYDRYAAICHPLHYRQILSRKKCSLLISGCWIFGGLNSLVLTIPASKMSFCHSNKIFQFLCDPKALTRIACAGTDTFYTALYVEIMPIGLVLFLSTLISYVQILRVILGIRSKEGRRKAFSTCSSHIIVITMYYSTAATAQMIPSSPHTSLPEQVITVVYTMVTPMLNPFIYSLRNQELRKAIKTFLR